MCNISLPWPIGRGRLWGCILGRRDERIWRRLWEERSNWPECVRRLGKRQMVKHRKHTVIDAWFMEQPPCAKKMYIMMVMAKAAVYIPRVDPIKRYLHALELLLSIFSRQYSAQVWARSTSKIRPRRTNSMAPMNAKYWPHTWKNDSGMKNVITTNASQKMILGPQYPFCTAALPSLDDLTPRRSTERMKWNSPNAKLTRCTATNP